ncbi:MAG: glycoside hydrolase family 140 protein [Fimbriimonadales bacterium]|nr:MAG: hypothetical protein KatS3mg018_1986 [Fimbriimonadales bacterium]
MSTLPKLRVFNEAGHPCRGRYLVTERGTPFFYLGDTAWELFHRLTREEAERYLNDRASKGFTVIQAVALAELDGLNTPNPYGERPLHNNDPANPNDAYFRHVDWVIDRANMLGLYVGLLPTWGDKVNKKWGVGPEIFTPENARVYGEFLGRRYREKGVLWILGGDRPVENETHLNIWRAITAGLREGDNGAHLMTYHPSGGQSSAERLHAESWLDFNMAQSGHGRRYEANYAMLERDYQRTPVKPCMDGEPCYEDHPIGFDPRNGWFDAHDVRRAAYWALLSGAHGHTYGCHNIWQMYVPDKRAPVSHARRSWQDSLNLPGAGQMRYAKQLMLRRDMLLRVPDQSLLVPDSGQDGQPVRAARAADGSYAYLYLPTPRPVQVRMDKLSGRTVQASWYDPCTGESTPIGEFRAAGERAFTPPDSDSSDWILVLERV